MEFKMTYDFSTSENLTYLQWAAIRKFLDRRNIMPDFLMNDKGKRYNKMRDELLAKIGLINREKYGGKVKARKFEEVEEAIKSVANYGLAKEAVPADSPVTIIKNEVYHTTPVETLYRDAVLQHLKDIERDRKSGIRVIPDKKALREAILSEKVTMPREIKSVTSAERVAYYKKHNTPIPDRIKWNDVASGRFARNAKKLYKKPLISENRYEVLADLAETKIKAKGFYLVKGEVVKVTRSEKRALSKAKKRTERKKAGLFDGVILPPFSESVVVRCNIKKILSTPRQPDGEYTVRSMHSRVNPAIFVKVIENVSFDHKLDLTPHVLDKKLVEDWKMEKDKERADIEKKREVDRWAKREAKREKLKAFKEAEAKFEEKMKVLREHHYWPESEKPVIPKQAEKEKEKIDEPKKVEVKGMEMGHAPEKYIKGQLFFLYKYDWWPAPFYYCRGFFSEVEENDIKIKSFQANKHISAEKLKGMMSDKIANMKKRKSFEDTLFHFIE